MRTDEHSLHLQRHLNAFVALLRGPKTDAAVSICAFGAALLFAFLPAAHGQETSQPVDISVASIPAEDRDGNVLIYYWKDLPRLAVQLSESMDTGLLRADVYEAPEGLDYVPIRVVDGVASFEQALDPSVVVHTLDEQWLDATGPSFNLDMTVFRPRSMWGGDWAAEVPQGEPSALITVRERDGSGFPSWDLRQMVPTFNLRGYYRLNYAERTCPPTGLRLGPSPSAEWPYVAYSGSFEAPHGVVPPPIVVDWDSARIRFVSELVTMRNFRCTYGLYSIDPLRPNEHVSHPNFESPFAFYNLDDGGSPTTYPNLIVRTERYPAGDKWLAYPSTLPVDYVEARYSWRLDDRPQRWDYKLGLAGRHEYGATTTIADDIVIDAPSYDEMPSWIVERTWPVVTFVDSGQQSYRSSEGIYDWSPKPVARPMISGGRRDPAQEYDSIRRGFRGEYRLDNQRPVELYLSPVDSRLHLVGAQGGLWNVDDRYMIRMDNLSGDDFIDSWQLFDTQVGSDQEMEPGLEEPPSETRTAPRRTERPVARLLQAADHLLMVSDDQVSIRKTSIGQASAVVAPPTDEPSLARFRSVVASAKDAGVDPLELGSWLAVADGVGGEWIGVTARDFTLSPGGFGFVVTVSSRAGWDGDPEYALLDTLSPGQYLVSYDRGQKSLQVSPQEPTTLDGIIGSPTSTAMDTSHLSVTLTNPGATTVRGEARLLIGTQPVWSDADYRLPARTSTTLSVPWTPPHEGDFSVLLSIGSRNRNLGTVSAAPRPRDAVSKAIALSVEAGSKPFIIGILGMLAAATGWVTLRYLRSAGSGA